MTSTIPINTHNREVARMAGLQIEDNVHDKHTWGNFVEFVRHQYETLQDSFPLDRTQTWRQTSFENRTAIINRVVDNWKKMNLYPSLAEERFVAWRLMQVHRSKKIARTAEMSTSASSMTEDGPSFPSGQQTPRDDPESEDTAAGSESRRNYFDPVRSP